MRPVLLVGDTRDSGFAALRTTHFAQAIDGVEVVDHRADVAAAAVRCRPRAVVTAGNFGPTRAALRSIAALGTEGPTTPLWLDVAGDPFAEAQAASAESADPQLVTTEATAVWAAAYARADAFSTVSAAGRHALLGALGLLGRLAQFQPGAEPVHLVPCAADFGEPRAVPRPAGHRVLCFGGFNTWFDDERLLRAVLAATARAPVEVTVAGGAISGHYEAGFARFHRGALASEFAKRFHFVGWVTRPELTALAATHHVHICLDRPGPEAELGARTRVLHALHLGLRVVATTGAPIVHEAASAGLVDDVGPPQVATVSSDPLVDALVAPRPAPPANRRDAWLDARSVAITTAVLRAWTANPALMPHLPAAEPLAACLAERDALRAELAALRSSPTFRVLDRVRRRW